MAQRLVVVTNVSGSFFRRLLETQRAGADRDAVAVFELVFEARFAVDEDFIGAATELAVDYGAVDDRERAML